MMRTQWSLGLKTGVLVTNPIPEADAMDEQEIGRAIETALHEADAQRIVGKDVTPFLLGRVVELTGERSLHANIALVKNNAKVAAEVAVAFAELGA